MMTSQAFHAPYATHSTQHALHYITISPCTSKMLLSLPNELLLDIVENFDDTTDVFHLLMTNKHFSNLLQPVLVKASNQLLDAAAANDLPLIHYAAHENLLAAAKLAVKADPDSVNESINNDGTALHVAVFQGNESIVEFLLDQGANPNATVTSDDSDGITTTPLQIALSNIVEVQLAEQCPDEAIDTGIVTLLLRRGADPNGLCELGMNSLLHAARLGLRRVVEAVLDTGVVDIHSRTTSGATALHIAVGRCRTDGVPELLIERGIDVNATNQVGQPALFQCQSEAVTRLLLRSGAKIGLVDDFGRTVLHYLADRVYPDDSAEIAQRILSFDGGIDVGLRDLAGLSAVDIATRSGNLDFIAVLKAYELYH